MKNVRREELFKLHMETLPIATRANFKVRLADSKGKPITAWFAPTVSKQGRTERSQEIEIHFSLFATAMIHSNRIAWFSEIRRGADTHLNPCCIILGSGSLCAGLLQLLLQTFEHLQITDRFREDEVCVPCTGLAAER
jgi:hypothetical protein